MGINECSWKNIAKFLALHSFWLDVEKFRYLKRKGAFKGLYFDLEDNKSNRLEGQNNIWNFIKNQKGNLTLVVLIIFRC